jgi:SsrA-binding protein
MTILLENKKIHLDYEVMEQFQAGIELLGTETKTLRDKTGSLQGAYIYIKNGEAYLKGAFIPPYQEKNAPADYDPLRERKLLLSKIELLTLGAISRQKGLTIMPISMYSKNRFIKVLIAVVRGKKKYDKRETLKKRDAEKEMRRAQER